MSHIILFRLWGELALWRSFEDPTGNFSCAGPAPSNIAGICGAALGMVAPKNIASQRVEDKQNKSNLRWPVSQALLSWEQQEDYHVGCSLESPIRRIKYNVNGFKMSTGFDTLRSQQVVLHQPSYRVAVRLKTQAKAIELAEALKHPAFPIFLGASFCRGFVSEVCLTATLPATTPWASHTEAMGGLDSTPLSCHVLSGAPRIRRVGYWDYSRQRVDQSLVKGYVEPTQENG